MNTSPRRGEIDASKPPKLVRAIEVEDRPSRSSASVIVNGNSESRFQPLQGSIIASTSTQTEGETNTGYQMRDDRIEQLRLLTNKVSSLCGRVDHLEDKLSFIGRELHLVRDLLQCLTRLVPLCNAKAREESAANFDNQCYPNDASIGCLIPRRIVSKNDRLSGVASSSTESSTARNVHSFQEVTRSLESPPLERPKLIRVPNGTDFEHGINTSQTRTALIMPPVSRPNFRNNVLESRRGSSTDHIEGARELRHPAVSSAVWQPRTEDRKGINFEAQSDILQYLSTDVNALDAIVLWEHGTKDFPPIRLCSANLSNISHNKIKMWQRLVQIFRNDFNGDVKKFVADNSDIDGNLLSTVKILAKYDGQCHAEEDLERASPAGDSVFQDDLRAETRMAANGSNFLRLIQNSPPYFILPRKINGKKISALDVINIWENGYFEIPPIKTWTPAQKLKQQSKISRWKKIIDILNIECRGDIQKFEEKYASPSGGLLPVAAIIAKYEAEQAQREESGIMPSSYGYNVSGISPPTMAPQHNDYSSATSMQHLRRERDTYDCYTSNYENLEPPIKKCPVDVSYRMPLNKGYPVESCSPTARTSCSSDGRRNHMMNGTLSDDNESSSCNNLAAFQAESIVSSSHVEVEGGSNDTDGQDKKEFTLPTQVDALDVIKLWEEGNQAFPAIKDWTPSQKLAQRSKISRWNKIVDIYRFECNNDLQTFQNRFSNSKGELLPITSIIARHCSEKEAKSPDCLYIPDAEPLIDVCTVNPPNVGTSPSSSSMSSLENNRVHFLKTEDPPLHVLPRKINGRKVSAKDVIQIWNHGLNNIPPVVNWSPQQKVKQQSKISRWKKIVDIFQHDCQASIEIFESKYSNKLGELLPIAAIIAKNEADRADQIGGNGNKIEM